MSDFQRNEFGKRRRIERQLRPQLRKDAEIPDQVYRSAGKAYKMILDGTVRQEAVQEDFEKKPKRGAGPILQRGGCPAGVRAGQCGISGAGEGTAHRRQHI